MATAKFKEGSIYKQKLPEAPQEDFVHKKHVEDFSLRPRDTSKVIGVAIFGIGRAGTIHLSSLAHNPRVKVRYIIEEDKRKWDPIRNYYNLADVTFLTFRDVDQALKDPKVRAVIVTSPTKTHEDIVTKALDQNKAVFCEKPVAETDEKARNCFEKARKAGQPLLVAFNRRFDPAFALVRERVNKGEIGHVTIIKTTSRDSPMSPIEYLRTSGGIFHDTAVHNIDCIVWILGEYPTRVTVAATANIPEIAAIPDYDNLVIVMTFPSGTIGVIDFSRFCNFGHDARMEVFGFKGMLTVENQKPVPGVEKCSEQDSTTPFYHSFASRFKYSYIHEMEHFLNVIEGTEKLSVDPLDVLAVNKIATACLVAAKEGRVVDITWSPEELPKRG